MEGDKQLGLKPDNLLQTVYVKHRTNQKMGTVTGKDDSTETYTVMTSPDDEAASEAWAYADTIIPEQSCVKVINLSTATWNGSRGVIVNCNMETGRYGVQMSSHDRIAVKFNRVSL